MTPEELEELKAIIGGPSGVFGPEILNMFVELNAFIKKHEPKPPWPPEEGQEVYCIDQDGDIVIDAFGIDSPNPESGLMFPTKKMARYVREFLDNKTPEYWEKEMENARD